MNSHFVDTINPTGRIATVLKYSFRREARRSGAGAMSPAPGCPDEALTLAFHEMGQSLIL
jgi:hypothetical protein